MGSELDRILGKSSSPETSKSVVVSGEVVRSKEDAEKESYVSADIARVLSPKLPKAKKTIDDLIQKYDSIEKTGRSPTPRIPLVDSKNAKLAMQATPSVQEILDRDDQHRSFHLAMDDPILNRVEKDLDQGAKAVYKGANAVSGTLEKTFPAQHLIGKQLVKAARKTLGSEVGKDILKVLAVEENVTVANLRKSFGLPKEEDWMNNTYTNLYKDLKAPDNILTDMMGLATSIVASPSTYMTFGGAAAFKVGKRLGLTEKGFEIVAGVSKIRTAERIAALESKGVKVTEEAVTKVAQETFEEVQKEVRVKFGEVGKELTHIKIRPDVEALPGSIVEKGGLKFAGTTIINGADVVRTLEKTGVPDLIRALPETKVGKAVIASEPVQDALALFDSGVSRTKDILGKTFIKNYGIDREMVSIWEDAQSQTRSILMRNLDSTGKWFKKYGIDSDAKKKDFYDSVSQAFGDETQVGSVKAISGDAVTQNAIDRWFAQGKYSHRASMPSRLAKYQKLFPDAAKANWFPGIAVDHAKDVLNMKIKEAPASRLFNKARTGNPVEYVNDPVQAVAIRRTQAAVANLQDQFHANVRAKKLGEPKHFASMEDAAKEGYVPLQKPWQNSYKKALLTGDDSKLLDELTKKEKPYFVKKEFADQYDALIHDKEAYVPVLSWFTPRFKQNVTTAFPAFHAANFTGNIVQNSMSIGGHAFDLKKHKWATEMVLGKNMDQKLANAIGETKTKGQWLKEAQTAGVVDAGSFMHDLAGDMLPDTQTRSIYRLFFHKMNPLSLDFAPAKMGREFGNAVENQARLVNYMTWRMKGVSPKIAKMEVEKALFDYSNITHAEKYAREFIPFYTFHRKYYEYAARTYAHKPAILGMQLKAMRDLGPTEEEWENIPKFFKNAMVTKFGDLLVAGWRMPHESLLETLDNPSRALVLNLNPLLRYTLEHYVTKKDSFTDRPLPEVNAANEFRFIVDALDDHTTPQILRAPYKMVADWLDLKRDDTKKKKIVGNPDRLHLLRAGVTSRYQSVLGTLQKEDKEPWETAVRLLFGHVRVNPDADIAVSNRKKEIIKKIMDETNRYNMAKGIPIYVIVGGKKHTKKELNRIVEDVKEAGSMRDLDRAEKKFDQQVEIEEEVQKNRYSQ